MKTALDSQYLKKVGGSNAWLRGWIGLSGPYNLELIVPILKDMFRAPYASTDWQLLALVHERSPPTLLLHGREDYTVRVNEAIELEEKLRAIGASVTCHIYSRVSHMDTVAAFSLPLRWEAPSLADVQDFIARTMKASASGIEPDNVPCPV